MRHCTNTESDYVRRGYDTVSSALPGCGKSKYMAMTIVGNFQIWRWQRLWTRFSIGSTHNSAFIVQYQCSGSDGSRVYGKCRKSIWESIIWIAARIPAQWADKRPAGAIPCPRLVRHGHSKFLFEILGMKAHQLTQPLGGECNYLFQLGDDYHLHFVPQE